MSDEQPIVLHTFDHPSAWSCAAARAIRQALADDLTNYGSASLRLSGGTTPAEVYAALAQQELDWSAITIGLVDERWLQPHEPASNAFLVRQHLLQSLPQAHFAPLVRPGLTLAACVAAANEDARRTPQPAVTVLGMGEDGHTASLFPGAVDLAAVMNNPAVYAAIDATGCSGANQWSQRITLTPAGIALASQRFLLIRGRAKREVLEAALASTEPHRYPIRVAIDQPGERLQVFWSA